MILRNRVSKLLLQTNGSNLNNKKKIASLQSTFRPIDFNSFLKQPHLKFYFSSSSHNNNKNNSNTDSNTFSTSTLTHQDTTKENDSKRFLNLKEADENQQKSSKKFFDTTPDLKFTEENQDLLVSDYTNSPTHLKFSSQNTKEDDESTSMALQGFYQSENGLSINQKSELQLKDNPLALKVLMEGKIDLRDDRIIVNRLNTSDSALLGNIEGMHQISLGSVDVLPQNSILLEDIDVNNIPEDKDIIIDKNTKVLLAVGKKVIKKKQRQTTTESSSLQEEGELNKENKESEDNSSQNSRNKYELNINKKIFEELSLDEYKDKYLWNFEKEFATFDFKMLLRSLVGTIPIIVITFLFFETVIELFKCKRDITLMEEQLMTPFINIRRQLQTDILLNDPRFDRKKLFPEQYNKLYNQKM